MTQIVKCAGCGNHRTINNADTFRYNIEGEVEGYVCKDTILPPNTPSMCVRKILHAAHTRSKLVTKIIVGTNTFFDLAKTPPPSVRQKAGMSNSDKFAAIQRDVSSFPATALHPSRHPRS